MKNRTLWAGGLFKLGVATANSRLLFEALHRKLAEEEKESRVVFFLSGSPPIQKSHQIKTWVPLQSGHKMGP